MEFGDKNIFAIECYHEPLETRNHWIFGRMCIWCNNEQLGDITQPACMLNVTEGFLQEYVNNPEIYEGNDLNKLDDRSLYDYLDKKLYADDDRTLKEVEKDAEKYFKYNFLTNGGESFDSHKSFLVKDAVVFKILFTDLADNFYSCQVECGYMLEKINQFISWMENEKTANKSSKSTPKDGAI